MSRPIQPSGTSTPSSSRRSVSAENSRPSDEVAGSRSLSPPLVERARAPARRPPPRTASRRPRGPAALKNGKHIAPPISTCRRARRNASRTPILSVTFAPPTTATSGRFGSSRMPVSVATSRSSSRPAALGSRCATRLGRGVRAVRGAERVVDVDVGRARRALGRAPGRSSSPPSKKRTFSSHHDVGVAATSSRVGRERTSVAEQLAEPRRRPARARTSASRPFGRPRCEQRRAARALARAARSASGSAAWMRASSVMSPSSSSGTLKSTRTRTRFPSTSEIVKRAHARAPSGPGRRSGSSSPTRCRTRRRP